MSHLEPKRPRVPPPPPGGAADSRKPENLVAEIVDQITQKQARAIETEPEPSRRLPARVEPADTPYRAILSCSQEPETS